VERAGAPAAAGQEGGTSAEILPGFAGIVVSDRYQNYVRHEAHCYIAC